MSPELLGRRNRPGLEEKVGLALFLDDDAAGFCVPVPRIKAGAPRARRFCG